MQDTPESTSLPYGVRPPRFRLPEATHVGGVHLQVSDTRRSLAYYEDVIGLRAHARTDESVVALSANESTTPLVTLYSRPGVGRARRGAFGLYHFAILLPDRAALGRFATHATRLGVRMAMADHLVSEALYLWDPDGLGIEIYADRPRETWQRHGQELVMTTDRLPLERVMAAAGGEPWTGIPRGTVMGHVHLCVGNLDDAEALYHRAVGLDKIVWSYPGALFMSAGGYHHHLATNVWSPGPAPDPDQPRLLEWELIVPTTQDVSAVEHSLQTAGYRVDRTDDTVALTDPWGTRVRIRT